MRSKNQKTGEEEVFVMTEKGYIQLEIVVVVL